MARTGLLLLHELFPHFPPLWLFLLLGGIVGAATTALVRRQRRGDARLERIGTAARGGGASGGILGVPWMVPGYILALVVGGGVVSLAIPVAALVIVPGYALMFMLAFSGALDHLPNSLENVAAVVVIGGGSWLFWSICAGVVWRLSAGHDADRTNRGQVRLDLGKPRGGGKA